jgi:hypothetical protein
VTRLAGPPSTSPRGTPDEDFLTACLEFERVPASARELDDFFDLIASMLLDSRASSTNRGVLPTSLSPRIRPDPHRAKGVPFPLNGG